MNLEMNKTVSVLEEGTIQKVNLAEESMKVTELFNRRVSMIIPQTFEDMPAELAEKRYSPEERPQVIRCLNNGEVTLALSYFDTCVEDSQVDKVSNAFQSLIAETYPANVFYDKVDESYEELALSWFDFKEYANLSEVYNLMFVTAVGGKTLLGIFTCAFEDAPEWKPLVRKMMQSVQDLTK